MTSSDKSSTSPLDRLIAAAPLERLVAMLDAELTLRARRLVHQQASVELELIKSFKADLADALADARNIDVIGNVADGARLSKRPLSTVRRICKTYKEQAGASKVEGEWSIHLPTFLAFIAHMPRDPRPAASVARTTGRASGRAATDNHHHLGEAA